MRLLMILVLAAGALVAAIATTYVVFHQKSSGKVSSVQPVVTPAAEVSPASAPTASPTPAPSPVAAPAPAAPAPTKADVVLPIDQFYHRITKKTFGLYVTPQNSPVQPEKFTGYHTGVDVEYGDVSSDIPVHAIGVGTVQISKTATGYGGVMAIKHTINGKQLVAIYGHLRASSMKPVGASVTAGEQIAMLGTAFSSETDGERRHLHFGLRADAMISILGYVQKQADLSGWQDPVAYFHNLTIN